MKNVHSLETVTHNSLLASVGVCDSACTNVVHKLDCLLEESTAVINNLVIKGESVEAQLQKKLKVRNVMDGKIAKLFTVFGIGKSNRDEQLDRLAERVDNLIEVVAKLVQQKTAEKKSETSPLNVSSIALDEEKPPVPAKTAAIKKSTPKKPSAAKIVAKIDTPGENKPTKPRTRKTVSKKPAPSAE